MKVVCPKCGSELRSQANFCDKCGSKIAEAKPAQIFAKKSEEKQRSTEALSKSLLDAERRQLTVMFCDIVGSTPLSEKLDPEDLRDVLHDYQSGCAKVIRGYDGYVARYFGDGILAYFGYPTAHEDDAQRAVRAGLGIVEGIKQLNSRLQKENAVKLEIRLGIHTGVVVAGDIDQNEQLESMAIVGETPNIADRLQKLAEPNTLVISSVTHQLVEGFFDCNSLGSHSLRGISQPVELYQVLHESGARTRLDTAELIGLTPLVGRKQELSLLLDRWEQAKEGMGHVVLLGGEAGIGKSRMVKVLKERVAEEPQSWLTECRCSPYHQNTVFYPIVDLFERVILQFDRGDSPEEKLNKVEGFLVQYGLALDETVPLFAALLSIPLGDSYSPLKLTPQQQKQKTLQILLDILVKRASQQPVLFVVEDLHWADASSLEFLDLLIDQGPTVPIFTVLTFRPTFTPPWTGRSHLIPMTLGRLTAKQVSDMVEHIAVKSLPAQILGQIVGRTDGVPLFVEELTKMVLESGLLREQGEHYELIGPLPPLAIPATLHDSLMARLDRLSAIKEVAQLGATLGREFSYELLCAVSPLDDESLQHALTRLVDTELLYQRGLPPYATYIFKHSLIRDTAYSSLLKSRRHQCHQQIAQALEKQFPEITKSQPEIVAYHYTEAGLSVQAIPHWYQAGQQAAQRSANVEAINHFTQGLKLLKSLTVTPENVQQEIAMQIPLGLSLIATRGYGTPEVEAAFTRARELCQKIGDVPQLFPALRGLSVLSFSRAQMQAAQELGERLLNIAKGVKDSVLLIESHVVLGEVLFHIGEFADALEHLEQALALYNPKQHRDLAFLHGRHSVVHCLSYMANALWALGYADKALEKADETLRLAHELDHPYTLAMGISYSVFVHQFRREPDAVLEQAKVGIKLCSEQSFPTWLASNTICHGWALAMQGKAEEGLAQIQRGIATWRAAGIELVHPYFSSMMVEALRELGRIEEGLVVLSEELAMMDKTGEKHYKAELHRLKSEMILVQGDNEAETEACLQQAIEVARRQQAKSLELRATVSLSRLWQKQGKVEEARKMLQEIYNWFTEGFDTKDLKEAKAVLEELS